MQGHYTGTWHSDGDYHFSAFNPDIDRKIIIDGSIDATVTPDGQISGTATGNVNGPITHDGKQDVSSGIGTISGKLIGTFTSTTPTLVLSQPVIDMHWGTFGGHAAERFITMPDYQFPLSGVDCVSGQGTISERDFPVQIIVPDGASMNPVQVPGIGSAGGSWQVTGDESTSFHGLSQQVDSFIAQSNSLLQSAPPPAPSTVDRQIVQPLKSLEATIRQNPSVSRCLLERLGAWELSLLTSLSQRAQNVDGASDLGQIREASDLVRSADLLALACNMPDSGLNHVLDAQRGQLDRAVSRQDWIGTVALVREMTLLLGTAALPAIQQQVNSDIHGLLAATTGTAELLQVARVSYALGDDGDASAAVKRIKVGRRLTFTTLVRTAKHKKGKKKKAVPLPMATPLPPAPMATPSPRPQTLEQILTSGVPPMSASSSGGADPDFSWNQVPGATRYLVLVTAKEGHPILWSWGGSRTSVQYGDTEIDGVPGTANESWPVTLQSAGFAWSIVALNDQGRAVALLLRAIS